MPSADGRLEPLKGDGTSSRLRKGGSPKPDDAITSSSDSMTLTNSDRSGESTSIPLPSLHGSLMRSRSEKDPFRFYEVVKILGEGSMGSVSKVHKRKSVLGGSARSEFVKEEKRRSKWWWCPGFGLPLFAICPISKTEETKDSILETINENAPSHDTTTSLPSSSIRNRSSRTGSESSHTSSSSSIITYGRMDVTYALKSIHVNRVRDSIYRKELMNEIGLLRVLDHPNIVKAMETFDYQDRMYLVLELCSGGDLYSRDPYDEEQACSIAFSVVDAVSYMHSKGITHRDLKFENIMFSNPSTYSVKLIDFGLSRKYAMKEHLHDTVGTVYTMAPEVLKGDYDNKCDIWSIGVIAFMLLSSSLPFYGKHRKQVVRRILRGTFTFRGERWNRISSTAKDFISKTLSTSMKERPSAKEALELQWLRRLNSKVPVSWLLVDNVAASIRTFATYGKLKKLALLVVAYKSTDEELGFLRKIFDKFDITNDGEITIAEFKEALTVYQYTDEELDTMFEALDIDCTGKVHYSEFLAGSLEAHGNIDEGRVADAFDRLDSDDSGYITCQNLAEILGKNISRQYIDSIIDEADGNDDHKIGYEEFLELWNENSTLHSAMVDVFKRRETYESEEFDLDADFDLPRSPSFESSGDAENPPGLALEHPEGKGSYFFAKEKEKSMRGVWL